MAAADMAAELPFPLHHVGRLHKSGPSSLSRPFAGTPLACNDIRQQLDTGSTALPTLLHASSARRDRLARPFLQSAICKTVRNSSVRTCPPPVHRLAVSGLVAIVLCGCVGPPSRVDTAAEQRAANNPAALTRIADIAAQAGDVQAADAFYKRAVTLDPANADSQIKYAQTLTAQGHIEEAIEQLTQAHAASPENPRVAATLGKLLVLSHRAGPATSVFRSALNTHPNNLPLLVGLGVALDAGQNPAAAQDVYRRVLAIEPHSTAARNDLALSLALSGHSAEALEQFRVLHTEMSEIGAPQSALATVSGNLALTYGLQGDLRDAAQTAATSLTPADLADNMRFYSALAPAGPAPGAGSELPAAPAVSPARPPAPETLTGWLSAGCCILAAAGRWSVRLGRGSSALPAQYGLRSPCAARRLKPRRRCQIRRISKH